MHDSGGQVYKGLAGMIIVDDDEQDVSLPNSYGVDDIPLIIQDRRFSDDGSMPYLTRYEDRVMGMMGDTILVNGTVNPVSQSAHKTTAAARAKWLQRAYYNLGFSDNRDLLSDRQRWRSLDAPVQLTRLQLAVAERAEILVEFDPGEEVTLVNVALPPSLSRISRGDERDDALPEYPGLRDTAFSRPGAARG